MVGEYFCQYLSINIRRLRGNRTAGTRVLPAKQIDPSADPETLVSMTGLQVRPATVDDHEALLGVWERSVRATHQFLTEEDITSLRPLVAEELASDALAWWVLASPTGPPAGFLVFANDTIEGLFLDPAHRGQGAGRALVAHAQQLAIGPLRVDVNEQNDEARGFYEAVGFRVVGRSPTDGAGRPFPLLHMIRTGGD
jgi:putative acetyltransferase